jgi:hypothetical protein
VRLTDTFFGPWLQIEGTVEIVPLPDAMDGLIDDYRRIAGEHPDWDDDRRAMVDQQRVLIRLSLDNVGPTHAGYPQPQVGYGALPDRHASPAVVLAAEQPTHGLSRNRLHRRRDVRVQIQR